MAQEFYQVDAFADQLFTGNPAGVMVVNEWPEEAMMQSIAAENNLAETAFVRQQGTNLQIRWFTPTVEVDLCGHATLASAHVFFRHLGYDSDQINFLSPRSGPLSVSRNGELLTMDFPTDEIEPIEMLTTIVAGIGLDPMECWKGKTDFVAVVASQDVLESITPNLPVIASLGDRGLIVTSPGREHDFVSRFFAPQAGVDEDPVTGSAHTTLTPLWAQKLDKTKLTARQISKRGGNLTCELRGDRVAITGRAVTYLKGELYLD